MSRERVISMSYNPSLDGIAAFYNGVSRSECPASLDEQGRIAWLAGWDYGPEFDPPETSAPAQNPAQDPPRRVLVREPA
jgi:ribosome modulation factor